MTQSERLGLDPQYIARERREDTGPETSAGTVMDAGRREFFPTLRLRFFASEPRR
jgi:hypothetical protein